MYVFSNDLKTTEWEQVAWKHIKTSVLGNWTSPRLHKQAVINYVFSEVIA